jgi:hypothetical protein
MHQGTIEKDTSPDPIRLLIESKDLKSGFK